MATYTPNLNLKKPSTGEYYDVVADNNDAKDKIDLSIGQLMRYPILGTETGVTNKHYPYGDIRRYGGVGDGIALDQTAFINAINSADKVILENKSYRIGQVMIQKDNISIIGEKMPNYKSDFSALENGTILKGTLVVDGNNHLCVNFGVDCGLAYTNAYTPGVGGDAFVSHNIAQLGVLNKNNHFKNIIGLVRMGDYNDPLAGFHAVLLESLEHGSADNVIGVGGWYGVVLKVSDFNVSNVKGIENDTCSVYVKSNTYSPVKRVNIANVLTSNFTARGFVGFMIQASNADLESVNATNIINEGGYIGTKLEGESTPSCKNVNISNVSAVNNFVGMQVKGGIYDCIVDNINVNMPESGVCFESGANTLGTPINDLQIGTIRAIAPVGTEGINHIQLASGVKFDNINCTVGYDAKGNIQLTGRVAVGDYNGKLSANRKASQLLNGWTTEFGQEVGLITKNGRTKGFGRLKVTGATSDVFFNLDASSISPALDYFAYALGYDGGITAYNKMIPVLISGSTGNISIPNRANYSGLSWIDLNSVDFPNDIDTTGGV